MRKATTMTTENDFLALLERSTLYPENILHLIRKASDELIAGGLSVEYVNSLVQDVQKRKGMYKRRVTPSRINLKVPFADKDQARASGAKWSANQKVWFVDAGADLNRVSQWLP